MNINRKIDFIKSANSEIKLIKPVVIKSDMFYNLK